MTLQKNNISATPWLDRKVVTMMSSNTQPSAVGTVLRRQVDTTRSAIPCPQNIITYNKYMGGVDRGISFVAITATKSSHANSINILSFFFSMLPSPMHTSYAKTITR